MNWKKVSIILGTIVGSLAIISGIYRGGCFLDNRWTKSEVFAQEIVTLKKQVTINSLQNQILFTEMRHDNLQKRIWAMEKDYPSNYKTLSEYNDLIIEKSKAQMRLNSLYQKSKDLGN